MPPWAYSEEDSRRESLAITSTFPAFASSIAARKPATPAPMTRKSQCMATAILTTSRIRHARMNTRSGRLRRKDPRFLRQHRSPARIHLRLVGQLISQLQKHFVVSEFGREQGAIERGQFRIPRRGLAQYREALAGAQFDQGGNEQAVDRLVTCAPPHQ